MYATLDASQEKSLTDCYYFSTNTCTKGLDCAFRHSEEAKKPTTGFCRKWSQYTCTDASCPMKHPQRPPRKPDPKQTVCYYYQHGCCSKGAKCEFLHPAIGVSSQKSSMPTTTPTSTVSSSTTTNQNADNTKNGTSNATENVTQKSEKASHILSKYSVKKNIVTAAAAAATESTTEVKNNSSTSPSRGIIIDHSELLEDKTGEPNDNTPTRKMKVFRNTTTSATTNTGVTKKRKIERSRINGDAQENTAPDSLPKTTSSPQVVAPSMNTTTTVSNPVKIEEQAQLTTNNISAPKTSSVPTRQEDLQEPPVKKQKIEPKTTPVSSLPTTVAKTTPVPSLPTTVATKSTPSVQTTAIPADDDLAFLDDILNDNTINANGSAKLETIEDLDQLLKDINDY